MKFIELIIGIICFLAIVSFITNCGGDSKNSFMALFTKMGLVPNSGTS